MIKTPWQSLESETGRTRCVSPRLGNAISQPKGVKLAKWSQENPKMQAFAYGNYRRHDSAGLSKVPAEQLAAFRRVAGNEGGTLFQSSGELDQHVLSYHLPFVKSWACRGHDRFISLTMDTMKACFRQVTYEHRYPKTGSAHYLTSVAEFAEKISP